MDPTPDKPEVRPRPRKKRPEPVTETFPIIGHGFGDHKFKVESKETRLEIVARLQADKVKLDHDVRKDFIVLLGVMAIVAVVTVACLFIVLSNRYTDSIHHDAMGLLAVIVSGGVGYATGKSSK